MGTMRSLRHTLAHLFHPRRSNNHRARVLHADVYPILAAMALVVGLGVHLANFIPGQLGDVLGFASSITPSQVVELTNQERARVGLKPLQLNATLSQAALSKGQDMFSNQYWAHTSPQGKEPWSFMTEAGYRYQVAGENLARDFGNTPDMVSAWMASPTHKANIVNNRYSEIGVAVIDGTLQGTQTTLVVQMFGSPRAVAAAVPAEGGQQQVAAEPAASALPQPVTEQPAVQPVELPPTRLPAMVLARALVPTGELTAPIFLSPLALAKSFFLAIIMMLVSVLVYDSFVIGHRSALRLVGKNTGHIIFLMVIAFLVILFKGGIIS